MTNFDIKGFEYIEDKRYLLGVEFPELRIKFDGQDKEYIKEISNLYLEIMDKIMEKSSNKETYKQWLLSTDFFTAPASTKYHSAFEGGLVYHSLLVLECLMKKLENPIWKETLSNVSLKKMIFAALTHDFCKINFYCSYFQNKKIYNETGKLFDENGKFDWKSVKGYQVNELFPYGHGEKSVYIADRHFFRLDEELALAIRGHMGFTIENGEKAFPQIVSKCKLALALSESDQESTLLLEYVEEDTKIQLKTGFVE